MVRQRSVSLREIPQSGTKPCAVKIMAYYTYVLLSLVNGYLYVGSAEDIENRLSRHNAGKVKSTKAYRPWKLLEFHTFKTRSEAFRYEIFLKTHQQKDFLKERHGLK